MNFIYLSQESGARMIRLLCKIQICSTKLKKKLNTSYILKARNMKQVVYCLIALSVEVVISLSQTSTDLNDDCMDYIKEVVNHIISESSSNKELLSEIGALKSALQRQSEDIANIKDESLLLKQIVQNQESLIQSLIPENRNIKHLLSTHR